MNRLAALALAASMLSPLSLVAGELSNTYVEVGAARKNFDGYGWDYYDERPHRNAAYVKGSWEFTPGFYVFGEHSNGEIYEQKSNRNQLGLGYTRALNDSTAVLAEGSYVGTDNEFWDGDGGRVSAGLRTQFNARLEGWAKSNYNFNSGHAGDGAYSLSAGGQIKFNQTWGLTSEVEHLSDSTEYKLGIRASF